MVDVKDIIKAIRNASGSDLAKIRKALQVRGGAPNQSTFRRVTQKGGVNIPDSGREFAEDRAGNLVQGAANQITDLAEALRTTLSSDDMRTLQSIPMDIAQGIDRMYKESQNFVDAGFTGQMYYDFTKAIDTASKASLDLTGKIQSGANALAGFRDNGLAFAISSTRMQENLVKTGVVLQQVGFDMDDYAKIVNEAAFSFNQNEEGISKMTSTLIQVQKEIPVAATTLSANFQSAQQNFAYSADKMMDTFIELQKTSVATGVDFQNLAQSFGESFDTFEGSAQKAGQLNQILGKSVFNSMELLTMTESERATTIRDRIMQSGRNIEDMGKFELRALSKNLGMNLSDTRKFLRGDLSIDKAGMLKKVEAEDPTKLKSKQLGESLDDLTKVFYSNMRPMDQFTLQIRKMARTLMVEGLKFSDGFKALSGTMSTSVALSADINNKAGLVDPSKPDASRPTGMTFKKDTAIATSIAERVASAIKDKDKGVTDTLAAAIGTVLAGQVGGKNPLMTAVANGSVEGLKKYFGDGGGKLTVKSKIVDGLLTQTISIR